MVTITIAQHLLVLTVVALTPLTPPTISALKAGDYLHETNSLAFIATPPLSPLYIAGSTAMARSTVLTPTVTGGPPLRAVAVVSTAWATTMVAYIPTTATRTAGSLYGAYGLASSGSNTRIRFWYKT